MHVDKFELRKYLYYGLIFVISFLVLVFMPMIGSQVGIGFSFPTTSAGWAIYVVIRLTVAGLNLMIFHCFMQQAKINVRDDKKFNEANTILERGSNKTYKPQGPREWTAKQYSLKGGLITLATLCSTMVLTNAILTYDWIMFLTYLLSILVNVIFGIMQMKSAEQYWTNEYWQYAKNYEEEKKTAKNDRESGENNKSKEKPKKRLKKAKQVKNTGEKMFIQTNTDDHSINFKDIKNSNINTPAAKKNKSEVNKT